MPSRPAAGPVRRSAAALPFQADRLARQPFGEPVRDSLHLRGPLQMVPDAGFGDSILRLGSTDRVPRRAAGAAAARWPTTSAGSIPEPSRWPRRPTAGRCWWRREFGAGRVLAFAVDSTLRWVMQGAGEQHRRLWRHTVLWLARKDDAEKDFAVGPPRPAAALARHHARIRHRRDAGRWICRWSMPHFRRRPSPLPAARGPCGWRRGETFAGAVGEFTEAGDWKLTVKAMVPGTGQPLERTVRFTIFRQDLELANHGPTPSCPQLAEATPGGVRAPEEIADILMTSHPAGHL